MMVTHKLTTDEGERDAEKAREVEGGCFMADNCVRTIERQNSIWRRKAQDWGHHPRSFYSIIYKSIYLWKIITFWKVLSSHKLFHILSYSYILSYLILKYTNISWKQNDPKKPLFQNPGGRDATLLLPNLPEGNSLVSDTGLMKYPAAPSLLFPTYERPWKLGIRQDIVFQFHFWASTRSQSSHIATVSTASPRPQYWPGIEIDLLWYTLWQASIQ